MVDQALRTAATLPTPAEARRVYCAEEAPLRLTDGTPLHLEWIIEDIDGSLYRVPSEPGGWLRRTPYQGQLDQMVPVSPEKVGAILWLTYADTADAQTGNVSRYREGSLELTTPQDGTGVTRQA